MRRYLFWGLFVLAVIAGAKTAWCQPESVEMLGKLAVNTAIKRLGISPEDRDIACLTNAGYVRYQNQSTLSVYDVIAGMLKISIGRGNLLPVHDDHQAPVYFGFLAKKPDGRLMMVVITADGKGVRSTKAVDVYVDKGQSFSEFKTVFGEKAFALVTLANGWADGIPETLMRGSLFHDHLCCGVASGYLTVTFIERHLPLSPGQKYRYIGCPAWCQDDYIMMTMNLTPGKHGYVTMAYPWSRPWRTETKTFDKLGGIIIRYDAASGKGSANLLRFDWREDDFRDFMKLPDMALDWKNKPWLHVLYNRFLAANGFRPETFVSVITQMTLNDKSDLERLTGLGANPLEVMLGADPDWRMPATAKKGADK